MNDDAGTVLPSGAGPPDLPVAAILPALLDGLDRRSNAVLVAPPGAGKTTLAPLALLRARWRDDGRIVVAEPRRLAARAASRRMADLLGEPVGARVGFRTRVDAAVSADTRVEVVTEGLLVARLLAGPTLDGVAALVFDEVHERNLDGDLALALALDLQRSRPELRVLAMSATADADAVARLLGGAPVHRSEGRAHPVAIRHAKRDVPHPRELPERMAAAIRHALGTDAGDVLAFLPGKGEIARTAAALAGIDARVLPLHGDLSPAAQDLVLRPRDDGDRGRRVVLATSIAETSLTVPGVRIVVDGGYRRVPVRAELTGLTRLATVRVSRAGADQRAGRAGRLGPGIAYRLWTEPTGRGLRPFDPPEILDADLAPLALALAAWEADWGTAPGALAFADPPPAGALAAGRALLAELGALDADGRLTAAGRRMQRFGTHPRLAAMLDAATDDPARARAALLAALLEERDPLAPRAGGGAPSAGADIARRLALLEGADPAPPPDADNGAIGRIRDAARRFRRRLGVPDGIAPAGDPAALLAAGFPDRIAMGRGEPGAFRLSGGGSASLGADDPLARSRLLVAPALHAGRGTRIVLASPLDPDRLPDALRRRATERVERGIDERTGAPYARTRLRLGALVLADRLHALDLAEAADALAAAAASDLDGALDWTVRARDLRDRVAIARDRLGLDLPPLDAAALAVAAPALLAPVIRASGATRLSALRDAVDVASLLARRLGRDNLALLDRVLPTAIPLGPGRSAAIDYSGPVPVASARAQWFYGLDRTPKLAGGAVQLSLALLSPAGRPVALTGDLGAFWRAGWAEIRREMKGRYPKHDWPEHPESAAPAAAIGAGARPGRR